MSVPVFNKVDIYSSVRGVTAIVWDVSPLFAGKTPWTFNVYASLSGAGDWELVDSVVDSYFVYDTTVRRFDISPRLHYRVDLVDADNTTYSSGAYQAAGILSDRDAAIAKEIIRKESVHAKLAGRCGVLLKRRRWGTKCTVCLDADTGEVTDANCGTCYGTGFVDGYFLPMDYWITSQSEGPQRRAALTEPRGATEDNAITVRGINCPWLDSKDVWVASDDRRYIVQTIKEISYRGYPIIFDPIELRLIPATDIVYTVPVENEESSSL